LKELDEAGDINYLLILVIELPLHALDLLLEPLKLQAGSRDSLQLDLEEAQIGILIRSLLEMLLGIGVRFVHQGGRNTSRNLQQGRRPTLVLKTLIIHYGAVLTLMGSWDFVRFL
jgi:hypothetical protein